MGVKEKERGVFFSFIKELCIDLLSVVIFILINLRLQLIEAFEKL